MKNLQPLSRLRSCAALLCACAALCLAGQLRGAPLQAGDVIAVDFSTSYGSAPNYNIITAATLSIGEGSVLNWADASVIDGVSIAFGGATGFTGENSAKNWIGQAADPYYNQGDTVVDIAYASSTGQPLTLTFSGLDTSLTYEARVYALDGAATKLTRTLNFSVTDGDSHQSITLTRGECWNAATLEEAGTVFENLTATDAGEIVVSVLGVSKDNPFVNAVVLVAVPEPALSALLLAGCALALCLRIRRR